MPLMVKADRKCYLWQKSQHSSVQALCLPECFHSSSLSGQGGDQHSQPFPRRGERAQLESHPGCFYYQTVKVSLSVLNTEGTLLLPLVCNMVLLGLLLELDNLLTTQLWTICQSPPFEITARQRARMQEWGTQPLMPFISSLASSQIQPLPAFYPW